VFVFATEICLCVTSCSKELLSLLPLLSSAVMTVMMMIMMMVIVMIYIYVCVCVCVTMTEITVMLLIKSLN